MDTETEIQSAGAYPVAAGSKIIFPGGQVGVALHAAKGGEPLQVLIIGGLAERILGLEPTPDHVIPTGNPSPSAPPHS